MSVYGSASWYRGMHNTIRENLMRASQTKRGYSDVDVIDMIEIDGVWYTPEDARRMRDAA